MRKNVGKIKDPKEARRYRRKLAIRKSIVGNNDQPRICVNRTNKNLFVQIVDDANSKTLFSVQTFGKNKIGNGADVESGKAIGVAIGKQLKSNGVSKAVFDRNGNKYCGIVASIATSVRESGIKF